MFENKETVEDIDQFLLNASNIFGPDLKEKISENIKRAKEDGYDFKIEINTEKVFVAVLFVTSFYVKKYEISRKRKVIVEEFIIGKDECREMLDFMESVQKSTVD